jgi:hypothetical protein
MKLGTLASSVAIGTLLIGLLSAMTVAGAESYGAARPKGQYAALDTLPDWGGVWFMKRPPPGTVAERPALKSQYLKDYQEWQRIVRENNGVAPRRGSNCRPPGMPGMMATAQYPLEFLLTPGRVTILHEAWMQWRNIWTDGRPHPEDLEAGFFGHSTGHWDGDTLVVETIGIKDTVDLGMGMRQSGKARIVEQIHLAPGDADALVIDTVVTDPEALAQPWHRRIEFSRERDGELYEFVCAENDLNPVDDAGYTQQIIVE